MLTVLLCIAMTIPGSGTKKPSASPKPPGVKVQAGTQAKVPALKIGHITEHVPKATKTKVQKDKVTVQSILASYGADY